MANTNLERPSQNLASSHAIMRYRLLLAKILEAKGNITQVARDEGYSSTKSIYNALNELRAHVNKDGSPNDLEYDKLFFHDKTTGEPIWTIRGRELAMEGQEYDALRKRYREKEEGQKRRIKHEIVCQSQIYPYAEILYQNFPEISDKKMELLYMCQNCGLVIFIFKTLEFMQWHELHSDLFRGDHPAFLKIDSPLSYIGN